MSFQKVDASDEPRRGFLREHHLEALESDDEESRQAMKAVVSDIILEEFSDDVEFLKDQHPRLYHELEYVVENA